MTLKVGQVRVENKMARCRFEGVVGEGGRGWSRSRFRLMEGKGSGNLKDDGRSAAYRTASDEMVLLSGGQS